MVLKGISRLDCPSRHKAPVSLQLLEVCYHSLDLAKPSDQALWGVLCLAFFFLMRRSEIAARGTKFSWFALKASDIAVTDATGAITKNARLTTTVHIRLRGSKTNQQGSQRLLNRSGHPFLCPVFGALCLLRARANLPGEIPAAMFINNKGKPDCVTGEVITALIRRAAAALGSEPGEFSTHSLRAGGATHMYRAGVDTLTIQFHGRWASDTFKQYTRLYKQSVQGLAAKIVSGQRQVHSLQ
jgi:integrase